ncbi:MAG: hypothetical protein PHQ46_05175 [Negativicutes bacterium]|nr:hypothetical protein [Negativicutes bacterium]
MGYLEMYQKARNEYQKRLGEINADVNLSATGRANERDKAFAKYQTAINDIAKDYNKTMADKEESLKFCKEKMRETVVNIDAETIFKQYYLFRGFASKLAMADTEREFLNQVIDMAEGNEMQRRALVNNFSAILKSGQDFVAKDIAYHPDVNLWNEDANKLGKENNGIDAKLKAAIGVMESRLKQVYVKTSESLKTEKVLRQEERAKVLTGEMLEMNGDVSMIQRLFKQDQPNVQLPVFKMPGQEWADIVNSVNG